MNPKTRPIVILAVIAILLSIPAIAMRLSNEVHWSTLDFIIVAVLLLLAGSVLEIILRKVKTRRASIFYILLLGLLLLLVWLELAVGVFGTPIAGS